jgi:hypothetical protein
MVAEENGMANAVAAAEAESVVAEESRADGNSDAWAYLLFVCVVSAVFSPGVAVFTAVLFGVVLYEPLNWPVKARAALETAGTKPTTASGERDDEPETHAQREGDVSLSLELNSWIIASSLGGPITLTKSRLDKTLEEIELFISVAKTVPRVCDAPKDSVYVRRTNKLFCACKQLVTVLEKNCADSDAAVEAARLSCVISSMWANCIESLATKKDRLGAVAPLSEVAFVLRKSVEFLVRHWETQDRGPVKEEPLSKKLFRATSDVIKRRQEIVARLFKSDANSAAVCDGLDPPFYCVYATIKEIHDIFKGMIYEDVSVRKGVNAIFRLLLVFEKVVDRKQKVLDPLEYMNTSENGCIHTFIKLARTTLKIQAECDAAELCESAESACRSVINILDTHRCVTKECVVGIVKYVKPGMLELLRVVALQETLYA